MVRNTAGATRTVTMISANVTHVPVPIVTTFNTASGQVGYIQFNDHIATAETPLKNAISQLDNANVTDLILDLRYNGGGYLDMASEVAYMIGNPTLTSGRTFEKIVFNDKNPSRNPVTGESLTPTPFYSTTQGFARRWHRRTSRCPRSASTACTSSPGPAPARPANRSSIRCAA